MFAGAANLVAELDVLLSFADLAVCAPSPYVRPTMTSSVSASLLLLDLGGGEWGEGNP